MRTIGNILWFFFGGFWQGISWYLIGLLWCITLIGIPIGLQCFKFGRYVTFPFGKDVIYDGAGLSVLMNILWLILGGIPLAIGAFVNGLALCATIIGIPFGLKMFKFSLLALFPFGAEVVNLIY